MYDEVFIMFYVSIYCSLLHIVVVHVMLIVAANSKALCGLSYLYTLHILYAFSLSLSISCLSQFLFASRFLFYRLAIEPKAIDSSFYYSYSTLIKTQLAVK